MFKMRLALTIVGGANVAGFLATYAIKSEVSFHAWLFGLTEPAHRSSLT